MKEMQILLLKVEDKVSYLGLSNDIFLLMNKRRLFKTPRATS
jgi:hypothetical protein